MGAERHIILNIDQLVGVLPGLDAMNHCRLPQDRLPIWTVEDRHPPEPTPSGLGSPRDGSPRQAWMDRSSCVLDLGPDTLRPGWLVQAPSEMASGGLLVARALGRLGRRLGFTLRQPLEKPRRGRCNERPDKGVGRSQSDVANGLTRLPNAITSHPNTVRGGR